MKEINIVTLLRNFGPKKLASNQMSAEVFWHGIYWKPTNQALMHKFGMIPKDAALSPVMKHNA